MKSICIIGGGNAAHALAALLPFRGYETTMWCPFQDEAERINVGLAEQDGYMIADFSSHNTPSGIIKGKPLLVSKNPQDVVPDADVLIMPLPSFVYPSTLKDIKPHLRAGQILCVTPGQGAFDWYAQDILGTELMNEIIIIGLMPMPFNLRIETFGKLVHVQMLKQKYSIGVLPRTAYSNAKALIEGMFDGSVQPAGNGSFLEVTMFPINAVIHPARLYTLLSSWKEGDILRENPLFYEEYGTEAAQCMNDVNEDLIQIGKRLTEKGVPVEIPNIFDWLACYVYDEPKDSTIQRFFETSSGYKGFRCPLIPAAAAACDSGDTEQGKGFVPDFTNRYFTEDIPNGLCVYKGLADIACVQTPTIDKILVFFQTHMQKEFVVNGKLEGKDVDTTSAPQRFGLTTISDLKMIYDR